MSAYADNPAHRRAKLLAPTAAGREAVAAINPSHRAAAKALVAELGADRLAEVLTGMHELSAVLERLG